jgi:Nodulation protein Z (NodZ)
MPDRAVEAVTADGATAEDQRRPARPERYLLVKGRAGMGNRMLALLTAILYGRLSHRRLVVDWSDRTYSDGGENVFYRYFSCPSSDPAAKIPAEGSVTPVVWQGRLDQSLSEVAWRFRDAYSEIEFRYASSVDLSRIDQPEQVAVFWSFYAPLGVLRPHFRGEHEHLKRLGTEEILRELARFHLALRPEIRERVDRFRRERFGGSMVGVHVRYTDRRSRLEAILKKVDLVRRRGPCRIFLATDNSTIQGLFVDRYREVISTPHWYAPDGERIHQSAACPDRFQNGVEALLDLYLLAECDYLVGDSTSSFARVADLLSLASASRRFDVKPSRLFNLRREAIEQAARDAGHVLRTRLMYRRER